MILSDHKAGDVDSYPTSILISVNERESPTDYYRNTKDSWRSAIRALSGPAPDYGRLPAGQWVGSCSDAENT